MKKFAAIILVVSLLATAFSFSVSALRVDGVMDESVWKSAQKYNVISSAASANCNVRTCVMSVTENAENNRICFGFKVKLTEEIGESTSYGVAVSINSSDFIYVNADSISSYNTSLYGVEYAFTQTAEDSFCVEVAVGLKYGLNTLNSIKVRVIDASGSPSTVYDVDYRVSATETAELTAAVSDKTTVQSPEKTTTVKTTKEKTTKEKTTKLKTTKPKTTKVKNNISDDVTQSTAYVTQIQTQNEEELTTTLNMKQVKFYDNLFKVFVGVLLVFLFIICMFINMKREKNKK